MAEIEELISMTGGSLVALAPSTQEDMQALTASEDLGGAPNSPPPDRLVGDELSSLLEVVEVQPPEPPLKRYTQRGWELCAHARAVREKKRLESLVARQEMRSNDLLEVLAQTMYRAPGLHKSLWKLNNGKRVHYNDPTLRAVVMWNIAFHQ